ncbi:MAG: hypothetical protein WD014_02060 [Dongiaceae bacterium]
MRLSKFATLAALASAVVLGRPAAAEHPCAPTVERRLDELNVDRAKIGGIGYAPRVSSNRRRSKVLGIDAWVGFPSCRGSLVIKMAPDCEFREAYASGACTLEGVARP